MVVARDASSLRRLSPLDATERTFMTSSVRRAVHVAAVSLSALAGMPLRAAVGAQATPLASWNAGPAKQAILDFVRVTTDRSSPQFVAPDERIATFDND